MPKPSLKYLKAISKEEKKTAKEYRKKGFPKIAKQEAKHAKFFEKQIQKRKK